MRANEHVSPEQWKRYLDGEMPDIECAEVAAHLTACPACRGDYAALQRILPGMGTLVPAPDLLPAGPSTGDLGQQGDHQEHENQ